MLQRAFFLKTGANKRYETAQYFYNDTERNRIQIKAFRLSASQKSIEKGLIFEKTSQKYISTR